MTDFEKICVVGLGYIGLPTAAMFASRKIKVVGVDVNPSTVSTINQGQVHIVEPDLDIVVQSVVSEGYFSASLKTEEADAFIVAVPTPFKGEDHVPDLSYIRSAVEAIAPVLKPGNLVILESTSPVGTTEKMANWISQLRPDLSLPSENNNPDISLAYCPERVLPGKIMQELISNDRIIGGMTPQCSEKAVRLYKSFVTGNCAVASGPRVAEMAKLTENSFRDVNIAFANELSLICEDLGIDVWELIDMANLHPRVNILQPGPGVGGHCIAVDPWFIVSQTPELARLIRTARTVNDSKPNWVLEKIQSKINLAKEEKGKKDPITVACYGLAFKPDIDDLRESPALQIVESLLASSNETILVVEPNIDQLPNKLADKASLVSTTEAISKGDVHILLVDHSEFKSLDASEIPFRNVIDTRGVWIRGGKLK